MRDHLFAGASLAMCFTLVLAGCVTPTAAIPGPDRVAAPAVAPPTGPERPAPQPAPIPLTAGEDRELSEPFIYRGTGILVAPGSINPPATPAASGDITLNFDATPIAEVVRLIVSDYLGKSYVIDSAVSGTVTLQSNRPLSRADLLPTLESLLEARGAAVVMKGDSYHIVPAERAAQEVIPTVAGKAAASAGFRSVIVPLEFIAVDELAKIVRSYGVKVDVHEGRNLLIVSGSRRQVDQVLQLVRTFDVDWLKGMSVGLYPLSNASADAIVDELTAMFASGKDQQLAGLVRLVSLERLNAVLVISPQAAYLDQIGEWVKRLDRVADGGGTSLYVYHVQNGRARDLAEVLNRMFSERAPAPEQAGYGDDEDPAVRDTDDDEVSVAGNLTIAGSRVRVIADEANNALVVMAAKTDYAIVERALRQLDIQPLQVLIEASIVEIRLSDQLRYGLEWLLRGRTDDFVGEGVLDFGVPGVSQVVPGFSYVVKKADEVRLAINALAEDAQIKVLSSPSLMVLNNQTATIRVGDEVPIPTRQSVSNIDPDAPTVNEIQYRDTGVLLAVTPRVNASGQITMDVDQEVSDVSETTTSNIDAPTIGQRHISSTVSIRSGETVVLGGLIREQETASDSGIPLLYKLPGIGKLFGQTTRNKQRTELVVLITPRAISKAADTRAITDEYRRKMLGLAPILDPHLQRPGAPAVK